MDKTQKEELELKLIELLENTKHYQRNRQDKDNRKKKSTTNNYVIRRRKGQKDKHITIN